MKFTIPIRAQSLLNVRWHWSKKAKLAKMQREATTIHWRSAKVRQHVPPFPLLVTLTRIAPRQLDRHDNLPASMKFCADAICTALSIDDRTDLIDWRYQQRRGGKGEYAVEVQVSARNG